MSPHSGSRYSSSTSVAERPVDVLQRLMLVPGSQEALALYRSAETQEGEPSPDLMNALRNIRQRLLAEASPDYWIQELSIGDDGVDAQQMDLAADAAAARLGEAAAVGSIIDELEGAGVPAVAGPFGQVTQDGIPATA